VRTPAATLTASTGRIWETDAEILPTVLADPGQARDLGRGLAVDSIALDNCYAGWSGSAVVAWPERGMRMTMTATGDLAFLVVYTPAGADFFCAEPVSNCTDAFNLAAQGRDDTGMRVLNPGQTMRTTVDFTAQPAHQPIGE
jgi:aldose 1-epimerase